MARPATSELGMMLGDTGARSKSSALANLIADQTQGAINRIIVVGCGNGGDAQALAERFSCDVDAIDIDNYFEPKGKPRVRFTQMDATDLKFSDATFDLAFSFHALEHIPNYGRAIEEIRRVLKPGGTYCIGTPNRTRVVGYVGVPDLDLSRKIRANLRDWRVRLAGRFRNEYGAHAGYSGKELKGICSKIGSGTNVSDAYYRAIYPKYEGILSLLIALRLQGIAWPSVYILGQRN
jgi:ubiquinone/menaquinone biosynthesis C-methylase UbiE